MQWKGVLEPVTALLLNETLDFKVFITSAMSVCEVFCEFPKNVKSVKSTGWMRKPDFQPGGDF